VGFMSVSNSVQLSSVKPSGPGRAYERYRYNSQPKSPNAPVLLVRQHTSLALPFDQSFSYGTAWAR
jgi:hypothetical protein